MINQGTKIRSVIFGRFDKRNLPFNQLCLLKMIGQRFESILNFSHLQMRGLIKGLKIDY